MTKKIQPPRRQDAEKDRESSKKRPPVLSLSSWRLGALAVAFIGFIAHAQEHSTGKLAWKLTKGDRFFVEEIQETRQTNTLAGVTTREHIQVTRLVRFTVLAKDERTLLEVKIERIKAEPEQPGAKLLTAFAGAVFQVRLGASGNVEEVQGHAELARRIAREDVDTARLVPTARDSVKALVENLFAFTPAGEVKKGDRWTRTARSNLDAPGTLTVKSAYTLHGEDEANRNLVKIGVAMQLAYVLPPRAGSLTVTEGLLRSDGAEGTLWFHPKLGRLVRAESKTTLRGTLTVATAQGMEKVEVSQHQATKLRVLDSLPLP